MTSTVATKGQTVMPKRLRDRFGIKPGATLDWREVGDSMRVLMVAESKSTNGGLEWLRRLGCIPAAPRDTRPVEHDGDS